MTSYGAPALMKGAHSYGTPVNAAGVPYVVCTTCHNQHIMNIYAASSTSPIAGVATGTYATYFFINGPYNINNVTPQTHLGFVHDSVLPPVPLWRIERSQRRNAEHLVLTFNLVTSRGESLGFSPRFFAAAEFLLMALWCRSRCCRARAIVAACSDGFDVVVVETGIGPVYGVDAVVGVEPFVV